MPRFLGMENNAVLIVCLNPVLQKTLIFSKFKDNEVNRIKDHFFDIAGKGIHVARVLSQLGRGSQLLTQCGGQFREMFLEQAEAEDIHLLPIFTSAELRFCYTLINEETGDITECVEEGPEVETHLEYEVMQSFVSHLEEADMLIISGSKAQGFSSKLYPVCVKQAKEKNKKIILDIRGQDLLDSLEFGPDFLKINLDEFISTFFETKEIPITQIKEKMIQLNQDFGIIPIITNGEEDILYFNEGKIKNKKPQKFELKNSIGCGDAFTAALAHSVLNEESFERAIDFALETAGKAASLLQPGRIPVV